MRPVPTRHSPPSHSGSTPLATVLNVLVSLALLLLVWPSLQSVESTDATESPGPSEAVGAINRGVQVVVFPDRIELQYELSLSPAAAASVLEGRSVDVPEMDDRRALIEAFRDLAVPEIERRCRVTVNGQPLALRHRDSLLFPKHYVPLQCTFSAPLESAEPTVRLQLVDGSFRGHAGKHAIALKTKEGGRILSSTVPLILSRVPRSSSSRDSAAHREAARRAEAVIVWPAGSLAATPDKPTATDLPGQKKVPEDRLAAPAVAEASRQPRLEDKGDLTWGVWVGGAVLAALLVALWWWGRVA